MEELVTEIVKLKLVVFKPFPVYVPVKLKFPILYQESPFHTSSSKSGFVFDFVTLPLGS